MTSVNRLNTARLHANTPSVSVVDNRGHSIKTLSYHRHPRTPDKTDERISHVRFSRAGYPEAFFSPRQYELWRDDPTIKAERSVVMSLSGVAIKTDGADDGMSLALNDVAGRPVMSINARGVTRRYAYESHEEEGRLLTVSEQGNEASCQVPERLVWAETTPRNKAFNLAGQCLIQFSPAGSEECQGMTLTGVPCRISHRFLYDDAEADWTSDDPAAAGELLTPEVFTESLTANSFGVTLTQTDARGNRRRQAFDRAGQLVASWLAQQGMEEKPVIVARVYNAAGQVMQQTDGNGIINTRGYEPDTLRLRVSQIRRPSNHPSGGMILQNITYTYDPAGNILSALDSAHPVSHWRNQRVVPENTYSYDTLYQLVTATGREMAGMAATSDEQTIPAMRSSGSGEDYVVYTRNYTYDRSHNMTSVRHSVPASGNNHTTHFTVSSRSNRSLLSTFTTNPYEVDKWFTAAGQQTVLLPGKTLTWNSRGELSRYTSVERDSGPDQEIYRYKEDSQRVIKITRSRQGNTARESRTLYLSDLELRKSTAGGNLTEELNVIMAGHARAIHWITGVPRDLANNQFRYTYGTETNMATLETDEAGLLISYEEFYPFGGTAVWTASHQEEGNYKFRRYSGKEKDATGLYYYGLRYYQPWAGRWLSADPAGISDGLNMFSMVHNNPVNATDSDGAATLLGQAISFFAGGVDFSFSLVTWAFPSFPTFSISGISLKDLSIKGILRKTVGVAANWIYKKTYRALLNRFLSRAESDEQRKNIVRGFRAATLGLSVAIAAAGVATAGLAIPAAVGVGIAAGGVAAAIGFFASPISSALSKLYARFLPARVSPHASGATANLISGGSASSALITHGVIALNDPLLELQERPTRYRSLAGAEIGLAAGTTSAIYNEDMAVTGIAAGATAMVSLLAMSERSLLGAGEIASAYAVQGALTGSSFASRIGLSSIVDSAIGIIFRLPLGPRTILSLLSSGTSAITNMFYRTRAIDTNNFQKFRTRDFTSSPVTPGPSGGFEFP
ncbi:TPA: RHS repeat-associated core domain-containing protein [Enterobacter cloacae]